MTTAAENYKVFKRTLHFNITTTMQTTEQYLHFKSGQTSVEDFENSRYLSSRHTDDNLEKMHPVIHVHQWHMINNILTHFRQDVGRKHQDNWCTLVLLRHHDNKPACTALSVTQFLAGHKCTGTLPPNSRKLPTI